ncbi:MAG: DUF4837 family protein [candidate division KSB1 bacterium]|jgi:hypothetical protein|nr:DUF4837 family protein [candidate division KSB1 bacterium]
MKRLLPVISIFLLIIYASCQNRLTGLGDDGDIRVLADSTLWTETEPILNEIFEVPIMTPQDEKVFTIIRGDLTNFKKFKNLIFVATLDNDDAISTMVKEILSPEIIDKIKTGDYLFIKKDQWATNQLIMFLVSTDTEALKNKMGQNREYLFSLFDDYWNETQKGHIYKFDEQKDIEAHLFNEYGWTIRVPLDYKIFIEKPDSQFVMLRRMLPERWLFVHWIENADPALITEEWCIEKRNELGLAFYNGDQVETLYIEPDVSEVEFLGRNAIRTHALWRNDAKQAGGPYRNYCFYDANSGRIFMLDFAIFSPRLKKSKRHYLRQAEIILHTFRTDSKISLEKK